jgi:hypothetical protein
MIGKCRIHKIKSYECFKLLIEKKGHNLKTGYTEHIRAIRQKTDPTFVNHIQVTMFLMNDFQKLYDNNYEHFRTEIQSLLEKINMHIIYSKYVFT